MSGNFAESDAEEAALGWLEALGYTIKHGPEIAYNVDGGERSDPGYHDTILQNRLHRGANPAEPRFTGRRGLRCLQKIAAGRGAEFTGPQPRAASHARRWRQCRIHPIRRLDCRRPGEGHRFRAA